MGLVRVHSWGGREVYSESLKFLVLNYGVLLGELLLLLGQVVKGAAVGLGVPVLGAEDVGALAGVLDEADLLVALSALVRVRLQT